MVELAAMLIRNARPHGEEDTRKDIVSREDTPKEQRVLAGSQPSPLCTMSSSKIKALANKVDFY